MSIRHSLLSLLAVILPAGNAFSQTPYRISGTWPDGAGHKLQLLYFPSKTPDGVPIDSVTVGKDGRYLMAGTLAEPQLLMLSDAAGKQGYCPLMGDGQPVTVDIAGVAYDYRHPTAAFTVRNDTLEHRAAAAIFDFWQADFLRKMSGGMAESSLKKAIEQHNAADSARFAAQVQAAADADRSAKADFLQRYGNTLAAPFFIEMNMIKEADVAALTGFYDRMGDRAKQSDKGRQLKHDIDVMARLSPGALAPDFTLNDPDGRPLTLSSLRGHVVLIDFWASWCAPCIGELPTVKAVYAKYKDSGLKVVSVSMDHVRAAWVKAIEKHQLPWLHVSSLKGMMKCPVGAEYQVHGIPQLYILDTDGRILAKNVRGEALRAKMDEIFSR